jgi:Prp8 binding protein
MMEFDDSNNLHQNPTVTNLNKTVKNGSVALIPTTENFSSDKNKSSLKIYSPNILLSGHKGEIYTGKFSNEGYLYATGGHDKTIMLWEVYEETCRNITSLSGHSNAILEVKWSQDDSKLFSCSADKTVSVWDVYESKRLKKFKGHDSFVNCIDVSRRGPEMVRKKKIYFFKIKKKYF